MANEQESPISRRSFLKAALGLSTAITFGVPSIPAAARINEQTVATQPAQIIPTTSKAPEVIGRGNMRTPEEIKLSISNTNNRLTQLWYESSLSENELYKQVALTTAQQFIDVFGADYTPAGLAGTVQFVSDKQIKQLQKSTGIDVDSNLAVTKNGRVFINMQEFNKEVDAIKQKKHPWLTQPMEQYIPGDDLPPQAIKVEFMWRVLAHEWGHLVTKKPNLAFTPMIPSYKSKGEGTHPDYFIEGIQDMKMILRPYDVPNGSKFVQNGLNEASAEYFARALAQEVGRPYYPTASCMFGANIIREMVRKANLSPTEVYAHMSGKAPFANLLKRIDDAYGVSGEAARALQAYTDYETQAKGMPLEEQSTLMESYRTLLKTNSNITV